MPETAHDHGTPHAHPPPLDADRAEQNEGRWAHTHLRRHLLEGRWGYAADRAVRKMAGVESAEAWPPSDISKNLFRDVVDQVSVLYDSEGVISNEDAEAAEVVKGLASQAKLWPILSENQRFTIGLRESFVRIDVVEIDQRRQMAYRVVSPDKLIAAGHTNNPGIPVVIEEYRPRLVKEKPVWTRDVLDVSNPENPIYKVEALEKDRKPKDITRAVLGQNPEAANGKWSGDGYPYRREDGRPYIPGVLYHARVKWKTWDAFWGNELVESTLRCVAYWTFWGHNVMDASWPIPWALDCKPQGGTKTHPRSGRRVMDIDSGSIAMFQSMGDKGGSLGNFQPGSDPQALGEAIRSYAADAVSGYGINPADAQRVSVDPRSGYALSLSRATIREQQDKQIPIFTPFDVELLEKTAATWNRLGGATGNLPEAGWGMAHTGMPLTSEERKSTLEEWTAEAAQGVASKVDLYMRQNRVTREEAIQALERIQQDNARFGPPGTGAPTPLV